MQPNKAATLKLLAMMSMGWNRSPPNYQRAPTKAHDEVVEILRQAMKQEAAKKGVLDDLRLLTASPKFV